MFMDLRKPGDINSTNLSLGHGIGEALGENFELLGVGSKARG